jgi:hypothetical protein
MKQTDINVLMKENVWDLIGKQWMLITAGDENGFNTMTASWGGIGWLWNKPVAFIFIRPERYTHQFVEKSEYVTLSFLPEEYRKASEEHNYQAFGGRWSDKWIQAMKVYVVGSMANMVNDNLITRAQLVQMIESEVTK